MSRPPHEPSEDSRQKVYSLAAAGQRQHDIALVIGLSEKTLRLHYRDELDNGAADANAVVIGKLHELVRQGNTIAAIFLTKCHGGEEPGLKQAAAQAQMRAEQYEREKAAFFAYRSKVFQELTAHCGPERCAGAIDDDIENKIGLSGCRDPKQYAFALSKLLAMIKESKNDAKK